MWTRWWCDRPLTWSLPPRASHQPVVPASHWFWSPAPWHVRGPTPEHQARTRRRAGMSFGSRAGAVAGHLPACRSTGYRASSPDRGWRRATTALRRWRAPSARHVKSRFSLRHLLRDPGRQRQRVTTGPTGHAWFPLMAYGVDKVHELAP